VIHFRPSPVYQEISQRIDILKSVLQIRRDYAPGDLGIGPIKGLDANML